MIYIADSHDVPWEALNSARATVANIFRDIGVSVRWARFPNPHAQESCASVEVLFDSRSSSTFRPGAMGYAFVCGKQRAQVHIFTDRILHSSLSPSQSTWQGILLGHVVAHEIAHVLEGVVRHSQQGLMKQNWTFQEMLGMAAKNLGLTSDDANLIHLGISRRRESGRPGVCGTGQSGEVPIAESYSHQPHPVLHKQHSGS